MVNGEGKILSANSSLQNVKCEKREGTPQLAHSVRWLNGKLNSTLSRDVLVLGLFSGDSTILLTLKLSNLFSQQIVECWETKSLRFNNILSGCLQWMVCDKYCCCEWAMIASYHRDNKCLLISPGSPGACCRRCCVCCTGWGSCGGRGPGARTGRDRHRTGPRTPPRPLGQTRSRSAGQRRGSYSDAWK